MNSFRACKALGLPAPFERTDQNDEEDKEAQPPQQPATDIDLELLKQLCIKYLESIQTSGQETSSSYLDLTDKTLKMTSAQVVKTSVTNNSSFQNYLHPDDHTTRTVYEM